jgi:hypothetical protein
MARADDPIAAPRTTVSRKIDGMRARVAENASDDAADRSLFSLKDEKASDRTILIFLRKSDATILNL